MYEKLYQKAREDQADIAISNFDSIYPDRIIPHPYYPDCPNQEQLKQEIFSHLIGDWKRSRSGDLLPIGGICGTSSTKEKSWKTTTYGFQITEKSHTKTCFFDSGLSCSQPNHLYSPDTLSSCFSPKTRQAVISTIQPDW